MTPRVQPKRSLGNQAFFAHCGRPRRSRCAALVSRAPEHAFAHARARGYARNAPSRRVSQSGLHVSLRPRTRAAIARRDATDPAQRRDACLRVRATRAPSPRCARVFGFCSWRDLDSPFVSPFCSLFVGLLACLSARRAARMSEARVRESTSESSVPYARVARARAGRRVRTAPNTSEHSEQLGTTHVPNTSEHLRTPPNRAPNTPNAPNSSEHHALQTLRTPQNTSEQLRTAQN